VDSATFLSSPIFLLLLVVISAAVGYLIGKAQETRRKELALAEAGKSSEQALDKLRGESQEKLEVLAKANANDMELLRQSHSHQVEQLNQAHLALVDSLKSGHAEETARLDREHGSLVDRLNEANNAAIANLEQRRQEEIQSLRAEHQTALDALRREHELSLQQLQERGAHDLDRVNAEAAGLRAERDRLADEAAALQETLTELRDEIREAKLTNMFSVAKSGDKLIRVVRSVQELASELDETSRTVTGGEYSFFEQIKDQRDRETVLSLAAGGAGERQEVEGVKATPGGDAPAAQPGAGPQAEQWMDETAGEDPVDGG
jgi:chromosome segregation ATPase